MATARCPIFLEIAALLWLISGAFPGAAQHLGSLEFRSSPDPEQQGPPSGMEASGEATKSVGEISAEEQADLKARRARLVRQYFENEKRDVDRLLLLATDFKAYTDNSQNAVLTRDMSKKIRKMEELSHDLRQLMYAGHAPRIKKNGNLFLGTSNLPSEGPNEPAKRLQQASRLSFELASRLQDTTYHYLDQANQNTFSVASLATAKEVVNLAAGLEGLTHEIRSTLTVSPQIE